MTDMGQRKTGNHDTDPRGSTGKGILNRTNLNRYLELSLEEEYREVISKIIIINSKHSIHAGSHSIWEDPGVKTKAMEGQGSYIS